MAASERDELLGYIRRRYGNHAGTVIQILTAWEAYGELFSEWRAAWTGILTSTEPREPWHSHVVHVTSRKPCDHYQTTSKRLGTHMCACGLFGSRCSSSGTHGLSPPYPSNRAMHGSRGTDVASRIGDHSSTVSLRTTTSTDAHKRELQGSGATTLLQCIKCLRGLPSQSCRGTARADSPPRTR